MKNTISKSNIELRHLSVITAIAVFAVIFQFLSCCEDCPTCPEPVPPELGNFRLYAWDMLEEMLISFDIPADTIVDSVRPGFDDIGDLFVTADGQRLLLMTINGMDIFNADDLSHIQTIDRQGFYYFDGGDDYAIYSSAETLYFIDPQSLMPFDSIPIQTAHGYLDTLENEFWCHNSTYANESYFYRIDCLTREVVDSFEVPVSTANEFVYNNLTNDLYFQGTDSLWYYIIHYDLDIDSIFQKIPIYFTSGGIAHSPDLKKVYSSDGGQGFAGTVSDGKTYVFDVLSNQISNIIPAFDYTHQNRIQPFHGDDLVITPDGRRAYTNGQFGGFGQMAVIDLWEEKIIKVVKPYPGIVPKAIAVGPVPED